MPGGLKLKNNNTGRDHPLSVVIITFLASFYLQKYITKRDSYIVAIVIWIQTTLYFLNKIQCSKAYLYPLQLSVLYKEGIRAFPETPTRSKPPFNFPRFDEPTEIDVLRIIFTHGVKSRQYAVPGLQVDLLETLKSAAAAVWTSLSRGTRAASIIYCLQSWVEGCFSDVLLPPW